MTSVPTHHGVKSSSTHFIMLQRGHSAALQISAGQGGQGPWYVGRRPSFSELCSHNSLVFYGRFWHVFLRLRHYILVLLSVCLSPGESLVCPVLAFSVPIKSNNLLGTSFLEQWFSQKILFMEERYWMISFVKPPIHPRCQNFYSWLRQVYKQSPRLEALATSFCRACLSPV